MGVDVGFDGIVAGIIGRPIGADVDAGAVLLLVVVAAVQPFAGANAVGRKMSHSVRHSNTGPEV